MLTSTPVRDLAHEDFEFVRRFVKDQSGITVDDGKEYLVSSRLAPLVTAHGAADVAELVARVRTRPHSPLGGDVIDALTTNETSFYRDLHPFESLRDTIIPAMIQQRQSSRRLTLWCGASSSGQEPYSIAMLLADHFPELSGWQVSIIATDISPSMLAKAEAGEYSQLEVNRGLPAPMLVRHFTRAGARWRISDRIRSMVRFQRMNLLDRWHTLPQCDLVFLRNVLIYFDNPTKAAILGQIRGKLAPDGYLMLGGGRDHRGAVHQLRTNHRRPLGLVPARLTPRRPITMMQLTDQDVHGLLQEVWQSLLDLEVDMTPASSHDNASLSAVIHIQGDWEGTVTIQASTTLATRIAAQMFMMEPDELDPAEVDDALGEVANMLGGSVKATVEGSCTLSLPTVISGAQYTLTIPGSHVVNEVWLATEGEPLLVRILDRANVALDAIGASAERAHR